MSAPVPPEEIAKCFIRYSDDIDGAVRYCAHVISGLIPVEFGGTLRPNYERALKILEQKRHEQNQNPTPV